MRGRPSARQLLRRGRELLRAGAVQNIISLYAVYCSAYLLALVTVPYLGRVLGPTSWGMLAVSQSYGGYLLMLMEYGFSLSATREVARYRDAPERLSELMAAVLGTKVLLALLSIGISLLIQPYVPVFRQHPELLWAAVFWAIAQGTTTSWYFQGLERMQLAVSLDALMKTLAVVALFVVVRKPEDAWKALVAQGTGATCSFALMLVLAYRDLPFRWPRPAQVVECLRRGLTAFIPRNAPIMYTAGNAFLLGLFVPADLVGYYAGADRISRALVGLLGPLNDGVYPRISAVAMRSSREALRLVHKVLALIGSLGLLMSVATFAFAPLLVRVILGPRYEPAAVVLRIMSLVPVLKAFGDTWGLNWMIPLGFERAFTGIIVAAGLVNVSLGLLLAPVYAHIGMAWTVVATQTVATLATYTMVRWLRVRRVEPETAAAAVGPRLVAEIATEADQ